MTIEDDSSMQMQPIATISDSVRRLLKVRRDSVLERLEDVVDKKEDRSDAVHQLRVSTRRAEAALEFFLPWVGSKLAEKLKRQLSKLRRATGHVRDCDVLLKRIRKSDLGRKAELKSEQKLARKSARRHLSKVVRRLSAKAKHAQAWKRAIASIEFDVPSTAGQGPSFRSWSQSQLALWLTAFCAEMPAAIDSFEQLHAFRLAGKRLRYALELLPAGISLRADDLSSFFEDLQSRLGEICDQELLRQAIDKLEDSANKKSAKGLKQDEAVVAVNESTLLAALGAEWPQLHSRLAALADFEHES